MGVTLDVGSRLSGPGAFLYEDGQFTQWGGGEGLLSGRVYAFAEGPRGERWFATRLGISRWADGTWRHWTLQEGLKYRRVFTLDVGRDGRVWFGHQDNGAGLGFIDVDGEVGYLTRRDGLMSDDVWEVSVAPDETVWVGTTGGLAAYSDGSFIAFGPVTGLDHSWVWPVLPVQNRVYVGTIGGGTYMLSLAEAANPPPQVEVYSDVSPDGVVLFRWETFPFQAEQRWGLVQTRYRLGDGPWSSWSHSREASSRSGTGSHVAVVQAKSLFGRFEAGGTVGIARVPIPVYRNPLFLGPFAALLALVTGLTALYAARLHSHREQLGQLTFSLNERIADRTAELVAANVELEAFGHSVSHDLKDPLMTVTQFSEHLDEALGDSLDEKQRTYLDRTRAAARRMTHIIDDLRDLSDVHRVEIGREEVVVDLLSLGREIIDALRALVPGRDVTFEVQPGITAVGDESLLRILLTNLLQNAWKYTGLRDDARIELGVDENEGELPTYYVRDNGIGFDNDDRERIFQAFERLHTDAEFSGTGLGLATVERIVRRNGGRVWAEGIPGEGAIFRFTLGSASTDTE